MKFDHVRVRDCACPDTPHEGHFVFVTSTLSLEGGVEAEAALIAAITTAGKGPVDTKALEVLWRDIFVRHGVVGWDLCNEDGEPIPFSLEALRHRPLGRRRVRRQREQRGPESSPASRRR
jgi:hypothetical protein